MSVTLWGSVTADSCPWCPCAQRRESPKLSWYSQPRTRLLSPPDPPSVPAGLCHASSLLWASVSVRVCCDSIRKTRCLPALILASVSLAPAGLTALFLGWVASGLPVLPKGGKGQEGRQPCLLMSVNRQTALFWMGKLRHNHHQQAEPSRTTWSHLHMRQPLSQEFFFPRPQMAEGRGSNELWGPHLRA